MLKVNVILICILSVCGPVSAQENTIREGVSSPWQTQTVSQAIALDQLFGPPQKLIRKRELNLWRAPRIQATRQIEGKQIAVEPRGVVRIPTMPLQIEGFLALPDDNTATPPDCAGAVSPDHILTALNSEFRIQDRKGKSLQTLSMPRFWAPLGPFRGAFTDPRVVWDNNAKRFIMIMLSDIGESSSSMLLARSSTADPLGEWRMTRISSGLIGRDFDFPIMAIAGNSLAISVSLFDRIGYEKTLNYVIPIANIHNPSASLNFKTFEDDFGSSAPAEDPDPTRSRVLFVNNASFVATGLFALTLKTVNINPDGSLRVGNWIPFSAGDVVSYSNGETLPQLGSDIRINAGNSTTQNCTTRGTNIWCVHAVRVRFNAENRVVVQYFRATWPVGGEPSVVERERIEDNSGLNYYAFPSIAVNKNNDVMIGYNRFNRNEYAGSYLAYRRSTDLPGSFFYDSPLKLGEDSYEKGFLSNRWGDYSTTVVDPADDTAFWTLQEYAATKTEAGTSLWGTYWAKVSLRNGACTVRLDRPGSDVPGAASTFRVTATALFADCSYLVAPNASWLRSQLISTTGTASIYEFQVSANRRNVARTATISFGSELFQVRQAANPNPPPPEPVLSVVKFDAPISARVGDSIPLAATVRNTGTRGAGRFRVGFYLSSKLPVTNRDTFTGVGCPQAQGLVTDELVTCTGNYQLEASLQPGTYYLAAIADDREEVTMSDRTPTVRVADGGSLLVQPSANAPAITTSGVVHGATALAGAVSPGQLLVLYGSRLGPATLTTLALDPQGRVSTVLAGVKVLFDGVASPMVYASAGQLSAIVPYSVSGKPNTQMVVELNGIKSQPMTLSVVGSAPGLFSVDFSGKNQVAALNEDGSFNNAANPAEPGKLVVLYGTGGGTFRSTPVDGAVIGLPLPEFLTPLTLEIGGLPAEILYAGPAPGLVSGVFQINARVPASIPAGATVPVLVRSGTNTSPAGTTIAVK